MVRSITHDTAPGREEAQQVVFEREVETTLTGVALTT
jgi:hypothetical protein